MLLKRDARCSLSHLEGDEVGRDSPLGATFTLGKRTESTTPRRTIRRSLQYKLQTVKNVSLHIFQLVGVVVLQVYHRSSTQDRACPASTH